MLIGEVARRSGVSARMLRHYESLGLLHPSGRTGSGYREYSGEDIRRIFHIESLRSLGLSLREIGRALDDPGFTPSALVDDLIRQTRERIAAETELLTRLRRIDAAEPMRLGGRPRGRRVPPGTGVAERRRPPARGSLLGRRGSGAGGGPGRGGSQGDGSERRRSASMGAGAIGRQPARHCWRRVLARRWRRCGNVPSGPSPRCPVTSPPPGCATPSPTLIQRSAAMRRRRSGRAEWPMPSRRSST